MHVDNIIANSLRYREGIYFRGFKFSNWNYFEGLYFRGYHYQSYFEGLYFRGP